MGETATALRERAGAAFADHFRRTAEVVASTPGRVNLLGDHTDYNGGYVLPTALPLWTVVALGLRDDARVIVRSDQLHDDRGYSIGSERRGATWLDYVQGATLAAARGGYGVRGFEAYVLSNIPIGRGLSSSAALEVSVLRALREALGWSLTDVGLALLARWGENNLVGVPVGILDPMACVLAGEGSALFLDTRSLAHRILPLPRECELVVIDSGIERQLAASEYRVRRDECAAAAAALGVPELRDVSDAAAGRLALLPPILARRVRHVVSENARVLSAVEALECGDVHALGALFTGSHASLRDDFEVSVPRIDELVADALALEDVYGARITGGGFGGAVVCLVRAGSAARVAGTLATRGATALLPAPGEPS